MKIAVALNSHLISEHTALLAFHYARRLNMGVELLHIISSNEDENEVMLRVKHLQREADKMDITLSLRKDKGKPGPALVRLIQSHPYHTVFCSTRAHRSRLFTDSVSQYLVRSALPAQLVVARINRMNTVYHCERIGIFGGRGLPDMHQMALGLGLASDYGAELLLGNTLQVPRRRLHPMDLPQKALSDHGFRSLTTLCQLAGVQASIAHIPKGEDALDFFLSRKISLLILSARKLPQPTRRLIADPIENLFQLSPVNCMILYPKV